MKLGAKRITQQSQSGREVVFDMSVEQFRKIDTKEESYDGLSLKINKLRANDILFKKYLLIYVISFNLGIFLLGIKIIYFGVY